MLNRTEVLYAFIMGCTYGTKLLIEKKERPVLAIILAGILLYSILGQTIGSHNPISFSIFTVEVVFMYLLMNGICWCIQRSIKEAYNYILLKKIYISE
jgi:hypothetical protein